MRPRLLPAQNAGNQMSCISPLQPRPYPAIGQVALALSIASIVALGCTPAHLPGDDENPQGVCGDGKVNGDETCDDGNSVSGDGCSEVCAPEIPPNCGDGILVPEEGEECDDGNMDPGDGCGIGCWIEGCGNGFLDPGEACEDGNNVEGDGCSIDCKSDESCGNGIVDMVTGEMCDDGDGDDTDNCPASCEPARCGDGFVQKGIESCDDGNGTADDGCTECILDSCGDAVDDPGEECDQGAANGSDGSSCFRTCLTTDVVMEEAFNDQSNATSAITGVHQADVNGDGRPDALFSTELGEHSVALLGKGDGTLGRLPTINISSISQSILADVNGDGERDLLYPRGDTVRVHLREDGVFGSAVSFSTVIDVGGNGPVHLAVAEVTGDSAVDIITANQASSDVTVLVGDGVGGFLATARFGTQSGNGGVSPNRIAIGDITDDGVADVITANVDSSDVALLAGLGGGAFAAPAIHSTVLGAQGTSPVDLVLADVTNDGKLDVITANVDSSDVTVLAQQGGTLATPLAFPTFLADEGTQPNSLAVADVNKDGVPDMVTANSGGDVSLIPGLGAGVAFGAPQIISVTREGESASLTSVIVDDLNTDNNLDIVVGNASGVRDIRVVLGAGDGTFSDVSSFHIDVAGTNATPTALALEDLDGDGRLDLLATTSSGIVQIASDGEGRFLPTTRFETGGRYMGFGDFDNDGDLDFISGSAITSQSSRGLQGPSGNFQVGALGSQVTGQVVAAGVGDFDSDNNDDAVTLVGTTIEFKRGNGAGSFSAFTPSTANLTGVGRNVTVADISGDSNLDLIVSIPANSEVNVLIGDGAGAFTNPAPLSTESGTSGVSPQHVIVADIDGEMGPDIVTANSATSDISVIRSTGSGTFADAKVVPAVFGAEAATVQAVGAGDFNGDGFTDLVSANFARGTISIIIGFGNGNFASPQTFTIEGAAGVAVADYDGDGLDDVLVGTNLRTAAIFLGKGHP